MKNWLVFLALLLPLAGCPKKNKQPDGAQPDSTSAPTDPDSAPSGTTPPASNRAVPASPSR